MKYYLYTHIRPDTNEIFYVGIARTYTNYFNRAYCFTKSKRNFIWWQIFLECKKQIKVIILHEFDNLNDCRQLEKQMIKSLGRLYNNSGQLANIGKGGEFSKADPQEILQYDLQGNFVRKWPNMYEAALEYNISFKAISQAVNKKGSCTNYLWRWYEKNFSLKIEEFIRYKKVYQFSKDCIFISEYSSMIEASKILNIDRASINNTVLGKRKSAGGFIWTFNKNICVYDQKEKIVQYDLNNNFIKYYDNFEQIKNEFNICSSTAIRNCFIGLQNKVYGYIWKKEKIYYNKKEE